jgi:uncharacterized membrane protein YkvA (DUF1232 family)
MVRIVSKRWRDAARGLKREVYTLYYACRDPRVPWYAKAVAACVVAYALSPIDLIPDFVPVLGYLDDVVLIPLGIALVLKLIPAEVLADCRRRAEQTRERVKSWIAAGVIIAIWVATAAIVGYFVMRWFSE